MGVPWKKIGEWLLKQAAAYGVKAAEQKIGKPK